uniref:Uncharacterized protein n=1 Tax=Rhizophora mucronata TaxID=61149 RepID=A0A2P2Q9V2_RHIMU
MHLEPTGKSISSLFYQNNALMLFHGYITFQSMPRQLTLALNNQSNYLYDPMYFPIRTQENIRN